MAIHTAATSGHAIHLRHDVVVDEGVPTEHFNHHHLEARVRAQRLERGASSVDEKTIAVIGGAFHVVDRR